MLQEPEYASELAEAPHAMVEPTDAEYHVLLTFRSALRRFLQWSAEEARARGLTPQQHQLLLAVRAHPGPDGPSIGDIADYLVIRHHSAVELVRRAEAVGLLHRRPDPADHRVVRLVLTEVGREHVDELAAGHLSELGRVAEALGISQTAMQRLSQEFTTTLPADPNASGGHG